MFYNYQLLCYAKKGKFSVIWLAGNHKKLSQKQIMSVNIEVSCVEIIQTVKTSSRNKNERFSLYLSSVLMNGLCIIKNRQCELLLDQVKDWFMFQVAAKTLHEDLSVRWTISMDKRRTKRKKREIEEVSADFVAQALRELQSYPSLSPSHYPQQVEPEISLQPERTPIVPTAQTQEKAILMSLVHEDDDEIMQKLDKIFGQQEVTEEEQRLPIGEGLLVPRETDNAADLEAQGLPRRTTDKAQSMEVVRHTETPPAVAIFTDVQQLLMTEDQRSSSISLVQPPAPLLQIPEAEEHLAIQSLEESVPAPADGALAHRPEDLDVTRPRKRMKRSLPRERVMHHVPIIDRQTELTFTRQNLDVDVHKEYEDVFSSLMELLPPMEEPVKNFLPLSQDEVMRGSSDTLERFQQSLGRRSLEETSRTKMSGEGQKQMVPASELYHISEEAAVLPESAVMQEGLIPEPPREEKSLQVPITYDEPVPGAAKPDDADVRPTRDAQEEKAEDMEVQAVVDVPQFTERQEEVSDLLERLCLIVGLSDEAYSFDDLCPLSTAKSTAASVFLHLLDLDNRQSIALEQDNSTDFAPIYITPTGVL
ncbi:uncharacterized protein LOC126298637 isoform X2 [Schistocerca gregaria]|uniref:uncharacterized protein LOC126298637 isoform X2 n=1 Tax=Schistocerca gregaria TaxID=7010 RepID=UPI00211F0501|nr:uncharacterized protein LOC126298637 isoform X2 [Schistocerca gregaria]